VAYQRHLDQTRDMFKLFVTLEIISDDGEKESQQLNVMHTSYFSGQIAATMLQSESTYYK
jgi:hypothetical protein